MATRQYINNHPKDHADIMIYWTEKLQGVTHDSEHWYFSQLEKLWKFHVQKDLSSNALTADASTDMPNELRDLGCNHFGDLDYYERDGQGYIFVPVENSDGEEDCGNQPVVAVFRSAGDNLEYIGYDHLLVENDLIDKGRNGWCAINPTNEMLYTSHNEVNDDLPIFRFQVDWDALLNDKVKVAYDSDLKLWETRAMQKHVHIPKYIQGGAFTPDGNLYISSGRLTKLKSVSSGKPLLSWLNIITSLILHLFDEDGSGGIFYFELEDGDDKGVGILEDRSSLTDLPFKYEYHSGFWKYEEPEGLTYWDIDQLIQQNFVVPGIVGQLHAILLDNNLAYGDEIFFKHYQIQ